MTQRTPTPVKGRPQVPVLFDSESFVPNRYFSHKSKSNIHINIYKDREEVFPKISTIKPKIKDPSKKRGKLHVDNHYERFCNHWTQKFSFNPEYAQRPSGTLSTEEEDRGILAALDRKAEAFEAKQKAERKRKQLE